VFKNIPVLEPGHPRREHAIRTLDDGLALDPDGNAVVGASLVIRHERSGDGHTTTDWDRRDLRQAD